VAAIVKRNPEGNLRAQARGDLDFYVISVGSGMLTFKKFCAVVKAPITNFSKKNFFLSYA
jgi:hypothetical protein|tara:strand:- start:1691 stop:1870 length:180 start_codon:yes stop_codon:yes gene_type:complete